MASNEQGPDGWVAEIIAMHAAGWPMVQVVSHEEGRVLQQIAQAARGAGLGCEILDSSRPPMDALPAPDAAGAPGLLVARDLHRHWGDAALVRRLRDLASQLPGRRQMLVLVAPVTDLPGDLVRDTAVVDVPLPGPALLETLVGAACRKVGATGPVPAEIAAALAGLTFDEASRVLRKLLVERGPSALESPALVLGEKKRLIRSVAALEIVEPERTLDDVGGAGELKRWLAERASAFGAEARAFGLPPPRGLLLAGVQGCGKSLAARAIASTWALPLARLDLGLLMGMDSPAGMLHEVLKITEAMSPAVLWIDEIEKALQSQMRGEASQVLGSFVTWLSEKRAPVFAVATANDVELLPPELARKGRFDEIFFFDLPEAVARAEIFGIHLARRGKDPGRHDLESLAASTEHFSGSEIEQVVVSGLWRAFAAKRDLERADLVIAAGETVPLYSTYEDTIKALREWSRGRARPAALERRRLDLFQKT